MAVPYTTFAVFYMALSLLPYFLWIDSKTPNNEIFVVMRLISGGLCLLLILRDYWPKILLRCLPWFWKLTLVVCLVLTPAYLAFTSDFDLSSIILFSIYLLLLSLLVEWADFFILFAIGIFFALVTAGPDLRVTQFDNLAFFCYLGSVLVIAGMVFTKGKEKQVKEKIRLFKSLSATIAHEMRTPLSALRLNTVLLKRSLPHLISTYKKEQANDASLPTINFQQIEKLPERFDIILERSFLIIDMLLNNMQEPGDDLRIKKLTALQCLHGAIETYPFAGNERIKITIQEGKDFEFWGDTVVFTHIIHNLLKNSIHFTKNKESPEVKIWFSETTDYSILNFYDNGSGIKLKNLPRVFDWFFSGREEGTGLGLSFCKMAMEKMRGSINCISEVNQYTQMILSFPKEETD